MHTRVTSLILLGLLTFGFWCGQSSGNPVPSDEHNPINSAADTSERAEYASEEGEQDEDSGVELSTDIEEATYENTTVVFTEDVSENDIANITSSESELEQSSTDLETTDESSGEDNTGTVTTEPELCEDGADTKKEWNIETVSQRLNSLIQLIEAPNKGLDEYKYITAIRGPGESLYVPNKAGQSLQQHLTTLLGFAENMLLKKDFLAGVEEQETEAINEDLTTSPADEGDHTHDETHIHHNCTHHDHEEEEEFGEESEMPASTEIVLNDSDIGQTYHTTEQVNLTALVDRIQNLIQEGSEGMPNLQNLQEKLENITKPFADKLEQVAEQVLDKFVGEMQENDEDVQPGEVFDDILKKFEAVEKRIHEEREEWVGTEDYLSEDS